MGALADNVGDEDPETDLSEASAFAVAGGRRSRGEFDGRFRGGVVVVTVAIRSSARGFFSSVPGSGSPLVPPSSIGPLEEPSKRPRSLRSLQASRRVKTFVKLVLCVLCVCVCICAISRLNHFTAVCVLGVRRTSTRKEDL